MNQYKALRPFSYSTDGVRLTKVEVDEVGPIPEDHVEGLIKEGYIKADDGKKAAVETQAHHGAPETQASSGAPVVTDTVKITARHRGGGNWGIFRGDELIESGLTKQVAQERAAVL